MLKGLTGIIVFAIGCTIFSKLFFDTLQGFGPSEDGGIVFAFLSFVLVGSGLWLIIQDRPQKTA